MVDAADDVGDLHVVVVDDDGEIVGRVAVAAEDDEVVEILVVEYDAALHAIVDDGLALARRLEAHGEGNSGRRFGRIAIAPRRADGERALLGFGRLAHLVELLRA